MRVTSRPPPQVLDRFPGLGLAADQGRARCIGVAAGRPTTSAGANQSTNASAPSTVRMVKRCPQLAPLIVVPALDLRQLGLVGRYCR